MGLTPELIRNLDLPHLEDEITARRYLEDQAWPEAVVCHRCKSDRTRRLGGRYTDSGLHKCNNCRSNFTVTVGTVFHATKLPLHRWLQVTAAVEKVRCSLGEIADAIDVTYRTAWRMRRLIRPDIKYAGKRTGPRTALCYPFLPIKTARPEHQLMVAINESVPRGIPEDRRADICQELALAILLGEAEVGSLSKGAAAAFRKVYQMHPTLYAPLSLDAPRGDGSLTLLDTLSEDDSIWNKV